MVALPSSPGPTLIPTALRRDATVEDEVFHCGYFADVVFKFSGSAGETEDVYGQSALFSLLSSTLRKEMAVATGTPGDGSAISQNILDGEGRRVLWLNPKITVRAFREVARYVYRLPSALTADVLPEVIAASRLLDMLELEEIAFAWGLCELSQGSAGGAYAGQDGISDSLACLNQLCTVEPTRDECSVAWRVSMFQVFTGPDALASPVFPDLPLTALRNLLQAEAVHTDPAALWARCLTWAQAQAAKKSTTSPLIPGSPVRNKLFGTGAKLSAALAPPSPAPEAVEWQRDLVHVADLVRFAQMDAVTFARNVEGMDPMLPDLRSAIYTARRRGGAAAPAGGPAAQAACA